MRQGLAKKICSTPEELETLRCQWDELVAVSRQGSVCLTWDWVRTWWQVYGGPGTELHVVTLWRGATLVGLAPLVLSTQRGMIGRTRFLRFLGTGESEADEVSSEYLDVIATPGEEVAVAEALGEVLATTQRFWDIALFRDTLTDSLLSKNVVSAAESHGIRARRELVGIRYAAELPDTWDRYLDSLARGASKRLSYKRRKFERIAGRCRWERADSAEVAGAMIELQRLHSARWTSRGKEGVFASERFRLFHQALMNKWCESGRGRIYLLYLDDVAIGALYNFRFGGTEYFYQGGFDAGPAAKYSPGMLMHGYAIEGAIADGIRVYDFMKGGQVSYKSEFGCRQSEMYDLWLYSPSVRSRLALCLADAKNWIRHKTPALVRTSSKEQSALNGISEVQGVGKDD